MIRTDAVMSSAGHREPIDVSERIARQLARLARAGQQVKEVVAHPDPRLSGRSVILVSRTGAGDP
ncbi:hypothetical protein [Streptomyces sp. NPDC060027]|uniref:hypothetical protein n=1 Tax=Streptomyces sp. NPDC060027 TaxID=3347040 RepID=UPI0036D1F166